MVYTLAKARCVAGSHLNGSGRMQIYGKIVVSHFVAHIAKTYFSERSAKRLGTDMSQEVL